MKSLNSEAVLGALIADSAALGLHWIYDSARIAEIEAARGPRGLYFCNRRRQIMPGERDTLRMAERCPASQAPMERFAC
jgi:hypothetical protein